MISPSTGVSNDGTGVGVTITFGVAGTGVKVTVIDEVGEANGVVSEAGSSMLVTVGNT